MSSEQRYEITDREIHHTKFPKKIEGVTSDVDACPFCGGIVEKSFTFIPYDDQKEVKIPGDWCRKCRTIFVKDGDFVQDFLKKSPDAKGYKYSSDRLRAEKAERDRRFLEERQERLARIPSAQVMICVGSVKDKSRKDFILVANREEENGTDTFYFESDTALEVLSAAFAEKRKKHGTYRGKDFKVFKIIYPEEDSQMIQERLTRRIVSEEFEIRPHGGYFDSVTDENYELVDALLYSLMTKRYEVLHATYDKNRGFCFTDIKLFRKYVKHYGKPEVCPDFYYSNSKGARNYHALNEESILKSYGYNVSESTGLSDEERHTLLAEIVDLRILSVRKIVDFLDFFITLHTDDKYKEARSKWEADIEFIENYRINPGRFLIPRRRK